MNAMTDLCKIVTDGDEKGEQQVGKATGGVARISPTVESLSAVVSIR